MVATRRPLEDLKGDLARWASAGLIAPEQIEAIVRFEGEAPAEERGISVIAEALGYAGSALALAGIGVALGRTWDDMSPIVNLLAVAIPTALAIGAGWLLRSKDEPAFQRLMSLLWALAVGGAAGIGGVVLAEFIDVGDSWIPLIIGLAMLPVAVPLWRLHGSVLQQMGVLAAVLVTTLGIISALPGEPPVVVMVLAAWAVGVAWIVLGWRRVIEPFAATLVLGSLLAAFMPLNIGDGRDAWILFIGIATGGALMFLSVKTGVVPLLGIGTVAVFGYVTAVVMRYFGDQLGVPVALTLIGAVFIGLGLVAARLGRLGRMRS